MRPKRGAYGRNRLFTKTIAAIDGAVSSGLEGYAATLAALGTHGVKHRTLTAAAARVTLAGIAAGFTTLGFIGKAFFCEKFLLAGSKGEFLAAILADDGFVLKHEIPLLN